MAGTQDVEKKVAAKLGGNDKIPKLLLELLGSIFLAWSFGMLLTGGADPINFGAAIFLVNLAIGSVAQGYCNPIIALNDGIIGRIPIIDAVLYIVCQFVGAFLGSGFAHGNLTDVDQGRYMRFPTRSFSWDTTKDEEKGVLVGAAFGIYLLAVAVFLIFFNGARHESNELSKKPIFGASLYAVSTIFYLHLAGPFTGGFLNMAIDTSTYAIGYDSFDQYNEERNIEISDDIKSAYDDNLIVYLIAPFIGLIINLILYVAIVSPSLTAGNGSSTGAAPVGTSDTDR
eukprot:CAMPEP_0115004812 /NCGR_PEP_ID=MMETSP0216-20121206/19472_1 /TAXON_ID=223996 /ORGANISM="Protocruzia adherens, Strain Boccale" /LENGTH=284 /DNA_ID=CAMNT_0002370965 /DNA_START=104 /DNA_END=958 /DNA_ORIENTATION=-